MATKKSKNLRKSWLRYRTDPTNQAARNTLAELVEPILAQHIRSSIPPSRAIGECDYEDIAQSVMKILFIQGFLIGNKHLAVAATARSIKTGIGYVVRKATEYAVGAHLRTPATRMVINSESIQEGGKQIPALVYARTPCDEAGCTDLKTYVRELITNLAISNKRQQMLIAHLLHGQSIPALSLQFGITPDSARWMLLKDLVKLRRIMPKRGEL